MKKYFTYKILRKLNFLTLIVMSTSKNSFLETEIKDINKVGIMTISIYIFIIFLFAICPFVFTLNENFVLGLDLKISFFILIYIIISLINFISFKNEYIHKLTEKYIKIYKPTTNRIYILNFLLIGYVLISWLIFLILIIIIEAIKLY